MSAEDRVIYWQRRCRDAERIQGYIEAEMESNRRWMTHCFDEERRLTDRCTFLYGEATRLGATAEQLRGPECQFRDRRPPIAPVFLETLVADLSIPAGYRDEAARLIAGAIP